MLPFPAWYGRIILSDHMGGGFMAKRIKCPGFFCRSKDCVPVTTGKAYKAGKGLVGGLTGDAVLGPGGALIGIATGFNGKKKVKFMCRKCGRVFTEKV